jgi:ribosomal protein S12 methylthiotransferase
MLKLGVVSLGCDKNTVDTEKLLGLLTTHGIEISSDPAEADYIIVNTCAFIESAKRESIDAIMEMARYKNGKCKKLIVAGCMANRYYNELKSDLTEADIIIRTSEYNDLPLLLELEKTGFQRERVISTPYHYAYLKISEGCNNRCTYCAIPGIRGPYVSRSIQDLYNEADRLIGEYGTKELILVAQDVTRYGIDLYNKYALLELLDKLETIDVKWIRLMYCYPELVSDELIKRVAAGGKIVRYFDIPLQHISDSVLKRMNRRNSGIEARRLIEKIRSAGDISIRSTFIAGFPGESEDDFAELLDFVKWAELDNCGFFEYSREEGTPAYSMKNQISKKIKKSRTEALYAAQTEVVMNKNERMYGKTIEVMYEGIDYDLQCFYGRTERSAPGIDSRVLFKGDMSPLPGEMIYVRIKGSNMLDLTGEIKD